MLGKLQTPRLRPMWAPEPGAAAVAALRGGWDPASLGEVGERPLPGEKSTPPAGPALDSGFLALRVTRQGLQPGRGLASNAACVPGPIPRKSTRRHRTATSAFSVSPPVPGRAGRPGRPPSEPRKTPGAPASRASAPGAPELAYSLGLGAPARSRRLGWGWGPLLAGEAGVTGGRRSAARSSAAAGPTNVGGGTTKVFPKDKRAPWYPGPRPVRQSSRRALRPPAHQGGRPTPAPVSLRLSPSPTLGCGADPPRAPGQGAIERLAATSVSPGRSSALPGNKSRRPRWGSRRAGREGARRGLRGAGRWKWDTPRGRPQTSHLSDLLEGGAVCAGSAESARRGRGLPPGGGCAGGTETAGEPSAGEGGSASSRAGEGARSRRVGNSLQSSDS